MLCIVAKVQQTTVASRIKGTWIHSYRNGMMYPYFSAYFFSTYETLSRFTSSNAFIKSIRLPEVSSFFHRGKYPVRFIFTTERLWRFNNCCSEARVNVNGCPRSISKNSINQRTNAPQRWYTFCRKNTMPFGFSTRVISFITCSGFSQWSSTLSIMIKSNCASGKGNCSPLPLW